MICTHVLGVIPLPDLNWVVDRIYGFANKAVYIVVGTGGQPARRKRRWRIENIPSAWTENQWVDLMTRRKAKDIEVHLTIKSHQPGQTTGNYLL